MTSPVTGLAAIIAHPPIGLYSMEVSAGTPHSGHNVRTRPRGPQNTDARGIRWDADVVPPGYGAINTWSTDAPADRPLISLSPIYLIFGGAELRPQHLYSPERTGFLIFNELLPFSVVVDIAPGVQLTLHWLLFLE